LRQRDGSHLHFDATETRWIAITHVHDAHDGNLRAD
jgi:hypothetical protein